MSENEFDIGKSLFGQEPGSDDEATSQSNHTRQRVLGQSLNVLAHESDSDDAAIIAAQQVASNRKASNLKGRTVKKGGGFQAMGLNANLLKAITRKGFSVPTPIQRKTIPLLLDQKDVVGMARTGSGKTAAFIIPMIEKLKTHSTQVGSRALILSPSRELALQTLQVTKELARGTDLRCVLLVGGDSLEEQFSAMSANPDIIIAAPGRFVHLMVEMNLDLSSMQYVVFDEADRLFEMGFAAQLSEILHGLPVSRQTLLFSATLPKSLVEFARAGLQDPVLVRLDAESKISPDLQSAFFSVKSSEKEGALLHVLQDVIHVPTQSRLSRDTDDVHQQGKKRKREDGEKTKTGVSPYGTIIFAATKHRVEYLYLLLQRAGYAVSHVYGSLDQTARKEQVQAFRSGSTNVLVVTDVAARGIDIPVLANVINYDFPSQAKIFVHRVGRTARAGQKGWSYSIIHDADVPYVLDLQLFLGRKLSVGRVKPDSVSMAEDIVIGGLDREKMQSSQEWVNTTMETDVDLYGLQGAAANGEKRYQQTRNSASMESAKRTKELIASARWNEPHPLFWNSSEDDMIAQREAMLAKIGGFRPEESVFEITARRSGKKNNEEAVEAIRQIRSSLDVRREKLKAAKAVENPPEESMLQQEQNDSDMEEQVIIQNPDALLSASDSELEVTFSNHKPKRDARRGKVEFDPEADPLQAYRDSSNFMSYMPAATNMAEDRAYSLAHTTSAADFTSAARNATMDLVGDDGTNDHNPTQIMRWDKRHKKYVRRSNDEDGSKGQRLVRGESGAKIAASFKSGRFDAWKKANRVNRVARVGEQETGTPSDRSSMFGTLGMKQKYKHKKLAEAKVPDKFRDDYEKKRKKVREKNAALQEMGVNGAGKEAGQKQKGGWAEKTIRGVKGGKITNSVDDIRKSRNVLQKRRDKNARPQKKFKKGR